VALEQHGPVVLFGVFVGEGGAFVGWPAGVRFLLQSLQKVLPGIALKRIRRRPSKNNPITTYIIVSIVGKLNVPLLS
jgi:hypothetical protein